MTAQINHAFGMTSGLVLFLFVIVAHFRRTHCIQYDNLQQFDEPAVGAIPGRTVQISGKEYRLGFKIEAPKLGDCALKMTHTIVNCNEKFGGEEVFIPRGSTTVDVSRVQTTEDILTHGMGAIGLSVGVLGLASVSVKASVAVTTETSSKHLTLMSSYDLQRGTLTLQNPQPLTPVGSEGALYLSEIELGGNEILIVTLEFASEKLKVEAEYTIQIKIIFFTITAKLRYVKETFKSTASVRVQFKSSWRKNIDAKYFSLDQAIEEVERLENMYVNGPAELNKLENTDESLHNFYYFSSWKRGPYGENLNLATVNNDLDTLTQQNTEINAVISKVVELFKLSLNNKREELQQFNQTLTVMSKKLMNGLNSYHTLSAEERIALRDVYGDGKVPQYFQRRLQRILEF